MAFYVRGQVSTLCGKTNHSLSMRDKREVKRLVDGKEHQEQRTTGETDHFSSFMFGNRKPSGTHNSQEIPEQRDTRSNHLNDWFLGRRREGNTNKKQETQLENFINNVDIGLLMETYDTIVATSKQYKPLMKEITPFFSKIFKK